MKAALDLAYLLKFIGDNEIFYYVPFMINLYTCRKRLAGISFSYIYFDCCNCPISTVTPQMGVSARVAVFLFAIRWYPWTDSLSCYSCSLFFQSVLRHVVQLVNFGLIAGSINFFSHAELNYYSRQSIVIFPAVSWEWLEAPSKGSSAWIPNSSGAEHHQSHGAAHLLDLGVAACHQGDY